MCDFIVTRMESYYVRRILDVANNRVSDPRSRYVMEAADVDKQQVHKVGRTVYTVPSASVAGATYTVDMDVGLCTCLVGRTGCGCKHQAAVAHMYKLATTNQTPQFSPHLRRLLYCVATRKPAAVTQSFFASLNEDNEGMVMNNTTVDDDDVREGHDDVREGHGGDGIREEVEAVLEVEGGEVDGVGEDEWDSVVHGEGDDDELLRRFDEFHDKVKARIQDNPT